jgi:hypothetical protein
MTDALPILLGVSLFLVVLVLATGVLGFAKGGPWYQRNANRLMNLRVAAQAVAVAVLALAMLLS